MDHLEEREIKRPPSSSREDDAIEEREIERPPSASREEDAMEDEEDSEEDEEEDDSEDVEDWEEDGEEDDDVENVEYSEEDREEDDDVEDEEDLGADGEDYDDLEDEEEDSQDDGEEDDDSEDEEDSEEDGEEGEDYEEQGADIVGVGAGISGSSGRTYDNFENDFNMVMATTLPQGVNEGLPSENANDVGMEVEHESNSQRRAIDISKVDAASTLMGEKQGDFNGGEIDGLICPICYEAWSSSSEHHVCCLPCGHKYGQSCIRKWLLRRGSSRCPLCKMKCGVKDIRLLYATRVVTADGKLEKTVQSLEAKCAALEKKNIYWSKKEVEWKKREADLCKQVKYLQERAAYGGGESRVQEDLPEIGSRELRDFTNKINSKMLEMQAMFNEIRDNHERMLLFFQNHFILPSS